ncbi:hypothetical protein H6CHR_01325 [Variovorax sp. PBL-H6]|nr:hypothetical protein H6CHR_01325 [Variovorax sp. PBL-H6]
MGARVFDEGIPEVPSIRYGRLQRLLRPMPW